MSFLQNSLASLNNTVQTATNPEYVKSKQNLKQHADSLDMLGLIANVVAVALGILGIILVASSAFPVGIVVLSLSAFSCFCGYNLPSLSDNLKTVAENPEKYVDQLSCRLQIKSDDLKKQLSKNTLGYQLPIAFYVDFYLSHELTR